MARAAWGQREAWRGVWAGWKWGEYPTARRGGGAMLVGISKPRATVWVKNEIRILYLDDVPAEVVMVNHELRKAGLAFRTKRVDSREAFLHELEQNPPNLILSDHGLPAFDGFTALAIARDK